MGKIIFTIAGMHRTGSSLLANWLQASGLFIGYNLYGAESSNPKGHFEDLDFLNLHKSDLKIKGLDESGLFVNNSSLSLEEDNLIKAKKLINYRQSIPIWGWKEPRTTLYLNSWKKLIPNLKVIVLERPQKEVVSSLYKRLKKNKWYFTNNTLKKMYWWYDINLKPKKWEKRFSITYKLYYQACEDFGNKYPNDILYINTTEFIKDNYKIANQLNILFNTNIEFADLDSIFESRMFSK